MAIQLIDGFFHLYQTLRVRLDASRINKDNIFVHKDENEQPILKYAVFGLPLIEKFGDYKK